MDASDDEYCDSGNEKINNVFAVASNADISDLEESADDEEEHHEDSPKHDDQVADVAAHVGDDNNTQVI